MTRKTKNSLVLFVVLVLIVAGGGFYGYVIQQRTITARKAERKKLVDFNSRYVFENLQQQLDSLNLEYRKMDSVLAARPFNIPEMIAQSKFFSFVNEQTREPGPTEGQVEVVGTLHLDKFDVDADLGQRALDDDG